MTIHFQREIAKLKRKLLSLSARAEESIQHAVRSFVDRDRELALKVMENDTVIDDMEVEVEEDCLKVLALHQPVATDLRFVVACLKINAELERIGDLAVNIAERTLLVVEKPPLQVPVDLHKMNSMVQKMVRDSLDALVNMDGDLAAKVCADDDEVDALNRHSFMTISKQLNDNPEQVDRLLHYLAVSRHMERTADHATNIAEDVIYMIEGQIVRHRVGEFTGMSGEEEDQTDGDS